MINLKLLTAKFAVQIKTYGVFGAFAHGGRQLVELAMKAVKPVEDEFDARYGTDTAGEINLWKYRIASPNAKYGVSYRSISEQHIHALLHPLPRNASFVDLGCGKGRTLIIAAAMGFETVIGVEFVPELAEIARANLHKVKANATVLCTDAAFYIYPDGPLIVYMYDPFGAAVMTHVGHNLSCHKEELWVIYVNPKYQHLFETWMQRLPLSVAQLNRFTASSVAIWHKRFLDNSGASSVWSLGPDAAA